MDIQHGLQVLELPRTATLEEARQAYKDMVNVWHPDRFAHNPRLKAKAENKLKEINEAYELVESFLAAGASSAKVESVDRTTSPPPQSPNRRPENSGQRGPVPPVDRTEAVVEVGTRLFLTACWYLYKTLAAFVADEPLQNRPGERSTVEPGPSSGSGCRATGGRREPGKHCGCGGGAGKR